MADDALIKSLASYGYRALSIEAWEKGDRPQLNARVSDHSEVNGHTLYRVHCAIRQAGSNSERLSWIASLRLSHLRELRKVLKSLLGEVGYITLFPGFEDHFALRGAPPGTTRRLDKWLQRLAASTNKGSLPPRAMYRMLLFLQAPLPDSQNGDQAGRFSISSAISPPPDDAFSIGDVDSDEQEDPGDPGADAAAGDLEVDADSSEAAGPSDNDLMRLHSKDGPADEAEPKNTTLLD